MRRLVELRRHADPIVCVDHIDQVEPLSRAMAAAGLRVRVMIEVDIGLGRVGVPPGEPTLDLARRIAELPGLQLAGIMGYEGHLLALPIRRKRRNKIPRPSIRWSRHEAKLLAAGLPCPIVSAAGTGSYL